MKAKFSEIMRSVQSSSAVEGIHVKQCEKVGNFGRCCLFEGHKGTHKNDQEEFVQIDIGSGPQ